MSSVCNRVRLASRARRWHLGVGNIVIPKSADAHRMRENLASAEVNLSHDELDATTALESGVRIGADPVEAAFTQM